MTDLIVQLDASLRLGRIGRAIREARGDLSQTELSARLNVPQTTISRWERGTVDFTVEQLRVIEIALDMEPGELLIAGGYVRGQEPREGVVREITHASFAEAIAMVRAAEELDLGVRMSNEWHLTGGPDHERVLDWAVTLSAEAPGLDD